MSVTMRQMLEAGVHFGHQTRFWNPKMAPFIFGHRNKIHIVNLEKTLAMYQDALKFVRQLAANKGTILFVGTKRQAREIVARRSACAAACRYVDHRWLGGMLTNFKTVKQSIKRLKDMEADGRRTARSSACRRRKRSTSSASWPSCERSLGGIKDMNGLPDALFVIDVGYQKGAVHRSQQAGHPGDRRGRHQQLARRRRLRDSRATTTRAARSACTRAAWPMRSSKAAAQVDRGNGRASATSSSKSRRREAASSRR